VAGPSDETESLKTVASKKRGRAAADGDTGVGIDDIGLSGKKRGAPTGKYCGYQGHRNAVRNGKFQCPKRRADWPSS